MDCVIVHGGLGTTSEALKVGVPVIVTGVLLMDQRFWGKRVHDLGIGPEPVHIKNFASVSLFLFLKFWNVGE
jgi:UDP:flavonoid glycosyltransferase YjiC (YdhE family)